MRHDQEIFLIGTTVVKDNIGNQIETPIEPRRLFAEELAVYSTEFYNAAVAGLRPTKQFEIYKREYRGEVKLKHDNITYRVIRTSVGKTSEKVRLTCEKVAADG